MHAVLKCSHSQRTSRAQNLPHTSHTRLQQAPEAKLWTVTTHAPHGHPLALEASMTCGLFKFPKEKNLHSSRKESWAEEQVSLAEEQARLRPSVPTHSRRYISLVQEQARLRPSVPTRCRRYISNQEQACRSVVTHMCLCLPCG